MAGDDVAGDDVAGDGVAGESALYVAFSSLALCFKSSDCVVKR